MKNVRLASLALVQSAGKTAQRRVASVTTEHTVTSPMLTAEELDKYTSAPAAKDMERCSTQNATTTSTMSAAASAHPTAPKA